jgi:hypothetical protein
MSKPQTRAQQIQAQVERSLRPFVGRVPDKMLARMRANLEEALSTHPTATALLDSLRDRPAGAPGQGTGPRLREGAEGAGDEDEGERGSGVA